MKTVPLLSRTLFGFLAVSLLALTGCAATGGSSTAGNSMMQSFQNYKAAWNRHDVPTLVSYYGQGGTLTNPSAGRVSGPALEGWLGGLFTAIPDFKVDLVSVNPVNDHALAEQAVIKGTWTQPFPAGPLAGAKPTGKSFAVPLAAFYEWKDGKITKGTHYFDQMAFLTQIGVIQQK